MVNRHIIASWQHTLTSLLPISSRGRMQSIASTCPVPRGTRRAGGRRRGRRIRFELSPPRRMHFICHQFRQKVLRNAHEQQFGNAFDEEVADPR